MLLASCSTIVPENQPVETKAPFELSGESIARMFASLPMGAEQLREVYGAVGLSSGNGYDEEYTLDSLMVSPGAGVGPATKGPLAGGGVPLRDMVRDYLSGFAPTKAGVDDLLQQLADSGYQVYWPYSEDWDGETFPVVTFDPGYGAESNYGYELAPDPDGIAQIVDTVLVDEALAMRRPVWVINSNSDSAFTPLELFAGTSVQGSGVSETWNGDLAASGDDERIGTSESMTPRPQARQRRLMLKSFTMLRNYDSWFGGASEFFVKCGSVDGFNASTDAELKLYSPSVTDFMIVVKRRCVGQALPYEAILVTDFTSQLEKLAFLIVEDDGGTHTNWKCEAVVKIQSKSYGISVDIPYNDKDDIVWRGQLSARFFEEQDIVTGRFGDVICSFELE